jgi:hypothetical protein
MRCSQRYSVVAPSYWLRHRFVVRLLRAPGADVKPTNHFDNTAAIIDLAERSQASWESLVSRSTMPRTQMSAMSGPRSTIRRRGTFGMIRMIEKMARAA